MSLSLRLPDSLHRKVRELAAKEAISINQFITIAVAEKMSALLTEDYLTERAQRADPAVVDRILARVPDVPPVPGDEFEPHGADERDRIDSLAGRVRRRRKLTRPGGLPCRLTLRSSALLAPFSRHHKVLR